MAPDCRRMRERFRFTGVAVGLLSREGLADIAGLSCRSELLPDLPGGSREEGREEGE